MRSEKSYVSPLNGTAGTLTNLSVTFIPTIHMMNAIVITASVSLTQVEVLCNLFE